MKYIIYLTTNLKSKVNNLNRIYIGIHKTENPEIFDGYIGCGVNIYKSSSYMYPKTSFQYAVKKYGTEAFKREVLFIYDSALKALKKEEEIVNEDFIKQSHTYNMIKGGEGYNECYKPIYQFDLNGNLIKKWESVLDLTDFYGYSAFKFNNAITHHGDFIGCFWARNENIDLKTYTKNKLLKTVYLYDLNGKFLKEFSSRKECGEYLECAPQSVNHAIINQQKIKNHYVSDSIVDLFVPKPRITLKNSIFYLYHTTKGFIGKFTGKEVMLPLGENSWKKISNAINENRGWYKDYYISTEELTKIPEKNTHKKQIEVYTKEGKLIEILSSGKELLDKYNMNWGQLTRILKGTKIHEKYIFIYSK